MYRKEDLIFVTGGQSNYRIPSIVAGKDGTIHAFCNDRRATVRDDASESVIVYVRKKLGQDWEPVRELAYIPGWAISMGAAVYDEITDTVMCSCKRIPKQKNEFKAYTEKELEETKRREEESGIKGGPALLYSIDGGDTWQERPHIIEEETFTHWDGSQVSVAGSQHGSGNGIQLRHGKHKGRLICPSRIATGQCYDMEDIRKLCYNNAIYSDDHGLTWKASKPVQVGTGEGTLIENADGTITYNSRAYYKDQKRYLATSTDGGASFGDFRTDDYLMEEKNIGCNASYLRVEREDISDTSLLPQDADGITVFVNPRSESRDHMTACISFDGGKSWKHTKLIHEGPCAYSCITFSRKEQYFYLLYECGKNDPYDEGLAIASFDLEWLFRNNKN